VTDIRGLAPIGWHVPTDEDWNKLVKCIDSNADTTCQECNQSSLAGGAMKEIGTTHWLSPNTGANNISGFTGIPGGQRSFNGSFLIGNSGRFWSSTNYNQLSGAAWSRFLEYNSSNISRGNSDKANGSSVRLVKD
jgi:hypothetical protein